MLQKTIVNIRKGFIALVFDRTPSNINIFAIPYNKSFRDCPGEFGKSFLAFSEMKNYLRNINRMKPPCPAG
jgi:hypothetical protein